MVATIVEVLCFALDSAIYPNDQTCIWKSAEFDVRRSSGSTVPLRLALSLRDHGVKPHSEVILAKVGEKLFTHHETK